MFSALVESTPFPKEPPKSDAWLGVIQRHGRLVSSLLIIQCSP